MRIGLREIRRSKIRFLLLGAAVGLLVFLLLFFQSVAGTLVTALTGGIGRSSADVFVYSDRARANPAASVLPLETVDAVAGVEGVDEAAPVAQAFVPVTYGGQEQEGVVVGIEPGSPGTPASLSAGRLPEGDTEALASGSGFDDGFAVGDRVTIAGTEVEVVGTAADAAFNAAPTLYLPLQGFTAVVGAGDGAAQAARISYVAVAAGDGAAAEVAERIGAEVEGVTALQREAAVAALPGVDTIDRSFSILYLLLFIVVTIVTGVFFLILTVQKRDALVLLRAIGAERRDVVALVLVQVLVVVAVGVVVGVALAAGLLSAARDTFGATLDVTTTAWSSVAVLGLGLAATVGAVRRVLTIEPADVTRAAAIE